ncbi:L,D-transpeptidase [Flavisolibacter ginsenosidimutans]|uniref:L,D-transpeptidase n=1 Tax=Flavisolibacter ginsenosidimutans TaxID=661481 RepID=A0A5B8ULD0_9BACT|nr:L,D-transpeptidase [Flavisolibacter ginsenosidimutans]QEC56815.1 L,D-transpeptidase [Flavisolibacter ginsenosidimutans]
MKKKIIVDISEQRLQALTDDKVVYDFPCVTGDAEHATPRGKFTVLSKKEIYRSKTYDAQMNYALQLTTDGIYIHESYNYSERPSQQSFLAKAVSDTAATSVSRLRSWFPGVANKELKVGNVNLFGSHGCVRLAHSDAVKLFEWAATGMVVEIK